MIDKVNYAVTSEAFVHSFKIALACLLGLVVSDVFHIENNVWLILTILIVMSSQTHFGGALQKSYVRILGTIIGALIASATSYWATNNDYIAYGVIFLSVLAFSYVATSYSALKDIGIMGAVTTVAILISRQSTINYSILRMLEILAGILIALLVSKLFFPIHARAQLMRNFAKGFRYLNQLYAIMYSDMRTRDKLPKVQSLESSLIDLLADQPTLIKNAKNELSTLPYNKAIAESLLTYQHRLFRTMSFLYQALHREPEHFERLVHISKLDLFNEQVIFLLLALADTLEDKRTLPGLENLESLLPEIEKSIQKEVKALEKDSNAPDYDYPITLHTLLFCCRYIVDEIFVLQTMIGTYRSL